MADKAAGPGAPGVPPAQAMIISSWITSRPFGEEVARVRVRMQPSAPDAYERYEASTPTHNADGTRKPADQIRAELQAILQQARATQLDQGTPVPGMNGIIMI
jgi:hypothetical protein